LSYIGHLSGRIHIISHGGAKKENKEGVIIEPVKVRDLKILNPG